MKDTPETAEILHITYALFQRLLKLEADETGVPQSCTINYLVGMCNQILNNRHKWDLGKSHRWIGYIQGVMDAREFTTNIEQRDLTRKAKAAAAKEFEGVHK